MIAPPAEMFSQTPPAVEADVDEQRQDERRRQWILFHQAADGSMFNHSHASKDAAAAAEGQQFCRTVSQVGAASAYHPNYRHDPRILKRRIAVGSPFKNAAPVGCPTPGLRSICRLPLVRRGGDMRPCC